MLFLFFVDSSCEAEPRKAPRLCSRVQNLLRLQLTLAHAGVQIPVRVTKKEETTLLSLPFFAYSLISSALASLRHSSSPHIHPENFQPA